jgi:hypothetical protein
LGQVADLLKKAEESGRCIVLESGQLHGAYPPSAAALASDTAIHGNLWAGTAAMEAALAGVPTLLMDREGWRVSPLYELGVGKVVFLDWSALWTQCVEHWSRIEGVPGFGDWRSILDELDPFRDGRAVERMATYMRWLLDGLDRGEDRESVMEQAAERFAERWGSHMVQVMDEKLLRNRLLAATR